MRTLRHVLAGVSLLVLTAALLEACTITERYDDAGRLIDRTLSPGLALSPAPDPEFVAVRQRGFGLAAGYGQVTLGYFDLIIGGIAGDRCAIPLRPQSGDRP